MVRTQVQLEEDDLAALREMAAERGASVSELVRSCVKKMLEERGKPSRQELIERALATVGMGNSGLPNVGQQHDDYLDEAYGEW